MYTEPSQLIMGLVVELDIGLGCWFLLCGCFEGNFRMLINKCNETLQGAIAIIINPLICAGQFEFQGWETRNTEGDRGREIILGCFHLSTAEIISVWNEESRKAKTYMII